MSITDKINLMQLNNIPVPRAMLEQGVAEIMADMARIFREMPQEEKDEIIARERKQMEEFHERHKDLLDNLSPIPAVKLKTLVDVLLQDTKNFDKMKDDEILKFLLTDFMDLFFEQETALGQFADRNPKQAKGNITYLPETDGASIRESATKIHESLTAMSRLLPCDSEEDIVNVFRQHTILFSYMQNLMFMM